MKQMETNKIETPHYRIEFGADRIVRFAWAPGVEVTLEVARQSYVDTRKIVSSPPVGLLVNLGGVRNMDRDSRIFFSRLEGIAAVALVGGSPVARLIGNLFIGLNRSPMNAARMFAAEEEAVEWLKKYL